MRTRNQKSREEKIAKFLAKYVCSRSTIDKQFENNGVRRRGQYQSAIAQLGQSLVKLKDAVQGLLGKFVDRPRLESEYGSQIPYQL